MNINPSEFVPFITLGIILFTSIFSFWCFNNEERLDKYSDMPYAVKHYKEHYRLLSHAFIHADEMHLIFNMFGLYVFGQTLEYFFVTSETFGIALGEIMYMLFYTTAIYAAVMPEQIKLKNDRTYSSLGASGAVNSIIFGYIIVNPKAQIGLFLIPFPLDAWIFGIVYLLISYFLAKRKSNNSMLGRINHAAHFWGALYGVIFMACVKPSLIPLFFERIMGK